jgi:ABC-type nitrate/sulfonate/bicarbonate transport system substrate-binding protein
MKIEKMQKRWGTQIALLLILSLVFSACTATPAQITEAPPTDVETVTSPEPEEVSVTIQVSGQPPMPLAQWYVAQQLGFFEENNLDVEFTTFFPSGAPQVEAGLRGEWDFALMGGPPSITGGSAWGMLTAGFLAEESGTHHMFVRPEDDVDPNNVGEFLRGKNVLVTVGSTGNMVFEECLRSWGLTTEDVEIVPLDPPSIVSAFTSGQGSMAQAYPPASFRLQQEGFISICDTTNLGVHVYPVIAANPEFVEQNPDASARFVEAIYRANELFESDTETVIPLIFEFFELAGVEETEENVRTQINELDWLSLEEVNRLMGSGEGREAMERMAQFFVSTGLLTEQPEITFLADDLVESALEYRQSQGR